jgi:hypothetical protein
MQQAHQGPFGIASIPPSARRACNAEQHRSDAIVLPHVADPLGRAIERIDHVEHQVIEPNARLAEAETSCQELQARLKALDQAGVPTIVQKSDTSESKRYVGSRLASALQPTLAYLRWRFSRRAW